MSDANKSGTKQPHRFKPGESGNPSGRPKMPEEIREAFRALTPLAIETLEKIMREGKSRDSDKIRASEIILDRGWGKPVQSIDMEANVGKSEMVVKFEGNLDEWSK